ncbi:F-box domain-containing protein [Arthroderma uncinatum]|uniref:F-box domain-containing protein n=1 Tax=Arthroderma uncinatum TaxID=74035 RepID=UPI00144A9424|nr:F-box domain-containing protein [Arthroderma uncinatum]KAF3482887.1 F-box domain-containing protein [Arthroderma uncinatum]
MLLHLPSELIYFIASFLPTASSLSRLAQTCRHLYNIVAADNYRIFQAFVQGRYPAITAPPLWRDAAHALTLRSHAFDRRAVTGRFVLTPSNATRIGNPRTIRTDRPTLGYRPVIDSYESWYANDWFARKEVLAWGAGADVVLRIKDLGRHGNSELEVDGAGNRNSSYDGAKWIFFNDLHDVNSWDDVAGLHLLGASSSAGSEDREDLILGRRNGEVVHLSISPNAGRSTVKARFDTNGHKLEYTDLSAGLDRVLAVALDGGSIAFYKLDSESENESESESVQPFARLRTISHGPSRSKCSKLLSNQQIAVGADGETAKIDIFNFCLEGVRKDRTIRIEDDEDESTSRKPRVTTIVSLPAARSSGAKSSSLFLSGWEDSKTRYHPF